MKYFGILLVVAFFFNTALAQNTRKWIHLNGPNTGNHHAQLLFGPKGEIISVGMLGYYQTTDDGATWEEHRLIEHLSCFQNYFSGLLFAQNGDY